MLRQKRSRRGSTADRGASEDTTTSSASTSSAMQPQLKRIKKEPPRESSIGSVSDTQPPSPNSVDLIEELFTAIVERTDENGRQLSGEFSLLPSRKLYPDYYETIKKPIDLKQIATKIQKSQYRTLDGLVEDLMLMTTNAMDYNLPASQIHKEAAMMKKLVVDKKREFELRESHRTTERTVRTRRSAAQVTLPMSAVFAALEYQDDEGMDSDEEGAPAEAMQPDSDDETSQETSSIIMKQEPDNTNTAAMGELYEAVVKMKAGARSISGPFLKLPSKRMYPDYYTVILTPVSLAEIKKKIKKGLYVALDEMLLDLQMMCQNAQTFNSSDSSLYRDSVRIEKYVEGKVTEHQAEIDQVSTPLRTGLSVRLQPEYDDTPLRKKFKFIVRSILEHKDKDTYPVEMFLEKPHRKDYPDYYDVITQAMDFKTIVSKVTGDKYTTEEAFLADIKLLCDNAKAYNEEGSDVYTDAVKFEEIVKRAQKTISAALDEQAGSALQSPVRRSIPTTRKQGFRPPTTPLQADLILLYEYVTDYADETGRKLSTIFQTLPAKTDMPSYYEVIKKPVDLDKIQYRIQHDQYANMDDLVEDFGQMFENAAMFNEPSSEIYKDSLILLNAVMEKGRLMGAFESEVPLVQQKVQEIIHNLMESVLKFEDPTGRNLADTIAECNWSDSDSETSGSGSTSSRVPLTLEIIRANVYRNRYRRLDRFQDDMFELLEKARFTAQPDSQTYEDAVDLHIHFIQKRDELCGNGEKLLTPALHYSVRQFQISIEQERKESKLRLPSVEKSTEIAAAQIVAAESQPEPSTSKISDEKCVVVGPESYVVGDFVYIKPYQVGGNDEQSLIMCVEQFVADANGVINIRGSYFMRPHETFHLSSRKFYEKELFKSDMVESHLPGRILGRCYVMQGKDYFKMKPLGFDFADVYVCETRYTTKMKSFKKIKVWGLPENSRVLLVKREKPVSPVRIPSVFADQEEASKLASAIVKEDYNSCDEGEVIDVVREAVLSKTANPEVDHVFYEQNESPVGYLKIGDCVCIKNDLMNHIVKIDKIFTLTTGTQTFVTGTMFVFPKDLNNHSPAKLFYNNEVFQTTTERTHPVEELTSRCAVLTLKDYATCRQTEIPEDQVYIMESKIQENGSLFKRHRGTRFLNVTTAGLSHATDDEIYFFERAVNPKRVVSPLLEAALSGKFQEKEVIQESPQATNSGEEETQSVTNASEMSFLTPLSPAASTFEPPAKKRRGASGKKSPKKVKYTVSGFILYGAEHRKTIKLDNPGLSFPDTSRAVSDQWKALAPAERKKWDNEAKRKSLFINDELRRRGITQLEGISFKGLGSRADLDLLHELEKRLDLQQANAQAEAELMADAAAAANHPAPPAVLPQPQPSTSQGPPQVLEAPKIDPAAQALALMQAQHQQLQRMFLQQQQQHQAQTRPLFLTLPAEPPKVKRALHSEVFLRYLENNGMGSTPKPAVSMWRRQMAATAANSPTPTSVPDYWPSLLQIDADTKNRGMELINKMWDTRNMIFNGTCGLVPANTVGASRGAPMPARVSAFSPPLPGTVKSPPPPRRATGSRK